VRTTLLIAVFALLAVPARSQTPAASDNPQAPQRSAQERKRVGVNELISRLNEATVRKWLPGLQVTANEFRFNAQNGSIRAQGNVTFTLSDVVVTTDDAIFHPNGEIQPGGNTRVRLTVQPAR
jgi:hypothetical protein